MQADENEILFQKILRRIVQTGEWERLVAFQLNLQSSLTLRNLQAESYASSRFGREWVVGGNAAKQSGLCAIAG